MRRSPLRLPVLAVCAFVFVSSELFPLSALQAISSDLNVSEAVAGLLLSGYAAVVAITVAPTIRWTRGWDRRTVLVSTMLLLAGSSLVSAAAQSYGQLMACRLIMALGHGLFWASIGSTAARLAPDGATGRATGTVFSGNALALIAGVPALNAVAAADSWRLASATAGIAAALAAWLVLIVLPPLPAPQSVEAQGSSLVRTRPTPGRRDVVVLSASTFALVTAYFASYTFVTPILTATNLNGAAQSITLLALGVLGLTGIAATARTADALPLRTLAAQVTGTGLAFVIATLTSGRPWTLSWLCLLAAAYSGLAVSWQSLVLKIARPWADAASAVYVIAFQIGIAAGPLIGGAARAHDARNTYLVSLAFALLGSAATATLARSLSRPAAAEVG
ncbi:MFS transporter [Nocardioides sp.]|uniref:MFS transporter n=1 Tax=Nocardioides sp. TaxID=35761 RepID=UPI0039E4E42C